MGVRKFATGGSGLIAAALLILSTGVLRADPIPPDVLKNIHDGCIKSCTAGAAPDVCETACTCVSEQTGATMTTEDLTAAESAMSSSQPLSPDLAAKAKTIQDRCRPAQ